MPRASQPAMLWRIHVGDLLDMPADVLVCSANVQLNLSGGAGGAFAMRYGPGMQEALHSYLVKLGQPFVEPGTVVEMPPCGSPYRAVLHAVAADAVYNTSVEVVETAVCQSLRRAAAWDARTVALTSLGTGYGRLSMPQFAIVVGRAMPLDFPPIESAVIGLRSRYDAEELLELLPALTPV